jgi:casein kinase I family protein HRR25
LCEKYVKEDGSHYEFREKVGLIGTARYMSINSHELNSQSRKDDLESLGYILVYLAKGKLPWMDIFAFNKK